ncbi:DoxX protein [Mesohalobacter halotolerans]|uniref:DoxX protein n=1 Tax=Mesohalobacter halotolerans TaxID=1883405 RepID=A0A4V6ALL0_9FLAO|nr:DoxX protein [Mesohalobacter halotolerans]MBS3738602.1 DoxX protein [Psychroflexus sp.]TKS57275.1 DoxX protein [Mesohalobacter halotolerans]
MNIKSILFIVLQLFLGGMMIYGSISKFETPFAETQEVVDKAQKYLDEDKEHISKLILYVSGMKQTGYFWLVLGLSELIFGLLVIWKKTSLIGGLFLLPITLNILLFHIFLEPDEIGELLMSVGLFLANTLVVAYRSKSLNFLLVK